jgi:diguanylate cyclase (GGDEF)-like protein/PAS domain S-box-containing protein
MLGFYGVGHDAFFRFHPLMGFVDQHRVGRVRAGRSETAELWNDAAALALAGAFECDLRDQSLRWTDGVFAIFGLSRDVPLDRQETVALYDEESRDLLDRLRRDAIMTRGNFRLDARIIRPDGTARWLRIHAAVRSSNGRATHLYGMKQDISDDRARLEDMRRLAELDGLTGLPGRTPFQRDFLDALPGRGALAATRALMLVDVDGFKQVNDRHGHDAGDTCLKAVAQRLNDIFPDARLIARIGGDEFALVMDHDPADRANLERRMGRALGRITQPIAWREHLLCISASAGIAYRDSALLDAPALFAAADSALYAAKRGGRNIYRVQPLAG